MTPKQRNDFNGLVKEFNGRCVRCGLAEYHLDRDHIKPKYQGGSEELDNIQPLCAWCNASKGPETFNWKEFRRKNGWIHAEIKLSRSHPFRKKQ